MEDCAKTPENLLKITKNTQSSQTDVAVLSEHQMNEPHCSNNPPKNASPVKTKKPYSEKMAESMPIQDPDSKIDWDFGKILRENDGLTLDSLFGPKAVPIVVESLDSKDDKLLAELAGVLAKIANGSPENTLAVCAGGAIPKLVPMLKSRSKVVVEQTIQALINITGHGLPGPRDEVINNNGVVLLLDVLRKTKKLACIRKIVWLMSHLCRQEAGPPLNKIRRLLPVLTDFLTHHDKDILTGAAWAISDLCLGDRQCIQAVMDAGCLPKLKRLLEHKDTEVIGPAMRATSKLLNLRQMVPIYLKFLDSKKPELQHIAACQFTNLGMTTSEQQLSYLLADAPRKLIPLMKSNSILLGPQSIRALTCIASYSTVLRDEILKHNGVETLLEVLHKTEDITILRSIAWMMSHLCRQDPPPKSFDKIQKMLPALAEFLNSDDTELLSRATWAIGQIADGGRTEQVQAVCNTGCVPNLISLLQHDEIEINVTALQAALNIISQCDLCIECLDVDNLIEPCVKFLGSQNSNLKHVAACTLTKIASGTQAQTLAVVRGEAVPKFVELMKSDKNAIFEQAVSALIRIANGGPDARVAVLNSNAAEVLMEILQKSKGLPFLDTIALLILNLSCHCNLPMYKVQRMLPKIVKFLYHFDKEILTTAASAIRDIAANGIDRIQAVIDVGCVPNIMGLLSHRETKVVTSSLECIVNLTGGTSSQINVVFEAGVIPHIKHLLHHQSFDIIQLIAHLIENTINGAPDYIKLLVDCGIFGELCARIKARKEAMPVVANVLPPFINSFDATDAQTVLAILDGLQNLLKSAKEVGMSDALYGIFGNIGIYNRLEALKENENEDICNKAYHIMILMTLPAQFWACGMATKQQKEI